MLQMIRSITATNLKVFIKHYSMDNFDSKLDLGKISDTIYFIGI
jgi:hypothetical protein